MDRVKKQINKRIGIFNPLFVMLFFLLFQNSSQSLLASDRSEDGDILEQENDSALMSESERYRLLEELKNLEEDERESSPPYPLVVADAQDKKKEIDREGDNERKVRSKVKVYPGQLWSFHQPEKEEVIHTTLAAPKREQNLRSGRSPAVLPKVKIERDQRMMDLDLDEFEKKYQGRE